MARPAGWLVIVVTMLASTACASSEFDRYLRAQRWADAERAFAMDSSLQHDPRALFDAAMLYLAPDGGSYDPERGRELLERLVELDAKPELAQRARSILAILGDLDRATANAATLHEESTRQITALTADVERMREAVARLEESLRDEKEEHDLLRRIAERLEGDLRDRDLQLRALHEELDRLKAIDLDPARRSRAAGAAAGAASATQRPH